MYCTSTKLKSTKCSQQSRIKPFVRSSLLTLTVITHENKQACCAIVERASHTYAYYSLACCAIVESALQSHAYYSYNTYKPVPRFLSAVRTLTLITRTIHTSLLCDCESASHTYGYYSYNIHKPVVRLLRALRTLTLVTRTIHTSLLCNG